MKSEKIFTPKSGVAHLLISLLLLLIAVVSLATIQILQVPIVSIVLCGIFTLSFIFHLVGFFIVNPNESKVLLLFGEYGGTVKENGFFWANPFFIKKNFSLKAANFMGEKLKVNDHAGNPIEIAAIVVWQVEETYKAAFAVDHYREFVVVQSESALRNLASKYPYDHFSDDQSELTLRAETDRVNNELALELTERLSIAGIKIVEARISHLAYASEIAGAMLQRQQASAVVAARTKIVEGAVGMVEMALAKLKEKDIIELDHERKAAMVSNLLVVLCGERNVSPVVNTGSLY